jgi:hypothetical protein
MRLGSVTITGLVLFAGFGISAKADNLVANGNFSPPGPGVGYYSSTTPVPGWMQTGEAGSNNSTQPFYDNGTIPVAGDTTAGFLQEDSTFSQELTGLTAGQTYTLSFYQNARAATDCSDNCGTPPTLNVTVGGSSVVSGDTVSPVGGTNPFIFISETFTASSGMELLDFSSTTPNDPNGSPEDGTLLLSDVSVTATTPEPSGLVLLGTSILGAAGMMRRRFVRS